MLGPTRARRRGVRVGGAPTKTSCRRARECREDVERCSSSRDLARESRASRSASHAEPRGVSCAVQPTSASANDAHDKAQARAGELGRAVPAPVDNDQVCSQRYKRALRGAEGSNGRESSSVGCGEARALTRSPRNHFASVITLTRHSLAVLMYTQLHHSLRDKASKQPSALVVRAFAQAVAASMGHGSACACLALKFRFSASMRAGPCGEVRQRRPAWRELARATSTLC